MALGKNAKVELLKRVPLFSGCSKAELGELARNTDELVLPEGRVLAREGKTGREFFVLVDGTVRITKGGRKLTELGAGDWFGEIALVTGGVRTASVTAATPVRVLVLSDRAFRRVVEEMPSIALKVLASLGERLSADERS
ncbi:MAG: cyclic nucleotide-binding domain-containing protein [Gaiellaceae bacterium]